MRPVGIAGAIQERSDPFQVVGSAEGAFNPVPTIHTPAHDEFTLIDLRHLPHETSSTALTAYLSISSHTQLLQLDRDRPELNMSDDLTRV